MVNVNSSDQKFDPKSYGFAVFPAIVFAYLISLLPEILKSGGRVLEISWVPSLGISLNLLIDPLSVLFGLIISLIGVLVILYAGAYLASYPKRNRFFIVVLVFMVAMLGLVFSGNLIALFVFWELTGISSYILIGFYHETENSRRAAQQALLVTGLGGLVLLVGFLQLGLTAGSFDLPVIFQQASEIQASPFYLLILILVLVGAFTKSAQFPFHFWLPGAMAAPAPVSAYLHSATMVKAGIYLLARLQPVLGGHQAWQNIIIPVGLLTMILGAWLAFRQNDLKRILAYSTVSVLGMLTFLLGLNTMIATKAAMVLLVAHALYKGTLFLTSGAIDFGTGTRNIDELGGLARKMPWTAGAAVLAGVSMAGLPPLFGFISKELLYEATLELSSAAIGLTAAAFLVSAVLISVAGMAAYRPFFGELPSTHQEVREVPWQLLIGPVVLAALGLLFGLFPGWAGKYLIIPAASASYGTVLESKLALWHGITPMLILSIITILSGIGLYYYRDRILPTADAIDIGQVVGPKRLYDQSWRLLERFAQFQTKILQNGSLPSYLIMVVSTALLLIGGALIGQNDLLVAYEDFGQLRFNEIVFAVLIVVATFVVVRSTSRLTAVAALGAVGFSIAMIYISYGAPDLAMTQFAIETLTVILFVLVLYRLPVFNRYTNMKTRARDAILAFMVGTLMTFLVIVVTARPLISRITPYFAENSYTLAKGRNIVNVILVDFRGIDTLGELSVLAVAAIGVFALMKFRQGESELQESDE